MPKSSPTWSLHAVGFNKMSKLERVDVSVVIPPWRRPSLWYLYCGDLQTCWRTLLTGLSGECDHTEISAPPPQPPDTGIRDHLPGWQKFSAWNGNVTAGYFHSSRLRHKTWRWRCKHAVGVPLRQLATLTRALISPVSFSSFFFLLQMGIHNWVEKPLSCVETLSLQTTCTFVQQLQGWITGRSDLDVLHSCQVAKTGCVFFSAGGPQWISVDKI